MCKLCNTNDQYIKPPRNIKVSEITLEFMEVVKQYTGHYPCNKCNKAYKSFINKRTSNTIFNIDKWIVKRMKYYMFNNKELIHINNRFYRLGVNTNTIENYKPVPRKTNQIYVTIDKNIKELKGKETCSYIYEKVVNKVKIYKSFNTLKEAQQYKKEVLCKQQVI